MCLDGFLLWLCFSEGNHEIGVITGALFLILACILLFQGLRTVSLDASGMTEYIGPIKLKHLPASQIHTVIKYVINGRQPITVLVFAKVSASVLETQGEKKLRKHFLFRHSLKFREGKPDWGDLCLGGGFHVRRMPYVEFSEERKALIQSLYPHAEYREAKRMHDVPKL